MKKKQSYNAMLGMYKEQWYKYIASLGITLPADHNEMMVMRTFVHKSFAADYTTVPPDNERLEFIGDAVLGAIIARQLFHDYPQASESFLTIHKIALVRTETLADVSRRLHLGDQLLLSVGEEHAKGRHKDKVLADVCEALIGMQYVVCGYDQAKEFVLHALYAYKDEIFDSLTMKSYKSQFQEWVQKTYKSVPRYVDDIIAYDQHGTASRFRSSAFVHETLYGIGEGPNKKKAQEAAARVSYQTYCMPRISSSDTAMQ